MNDAKVWWKSKTLWAAGLAFLGAVGQSVQSGSVNLSEIALAGYALVSVILRFKTDAPIERPGVFKTPTDGSAATFGTPGDEP